MELQGWVQGWKMQGCIFFGYIGFERARPPTAIGHRFGVTAPTGGGCPAVGVTGSPHRLWIGVLRGQGGACLRCTCSVLAFGVLAVYLFAYNDVQVL